MCTSYVSHNVQLGTGDEIRIGFDITVGGEISYIDDEFRNGWDYAYVLFAPVDYEYSSSTNCTNPDTYFSQYKLFQGGMVGYYTDVHKSITMPNPSPNGTYKIIFAWHNDRGNCDTTLSAIVDNLTITEITYSAEPEPEIDTNKYITLTVSQGDSIRLGIQASADDTPVKIESGTWDTIITATTNIIYNNYKSQSTTMTIYGDVENFECYNNGAKVTALDASHNTALTILGCDKNNLTSLNVNGLTNLRGLNCSRNQLTSLNISTLTNLEELYCSENQLTSLDVSGCDSLYVIACYDNQLSTQALDNLYCQLPDRTSQETEGEIVVSLSATDEIVLATNKTNATDKNWDVLWMNTTEYTLHEVTTVGTYVCGEAPSALANVEEQSITLYPNPAKDEVVLKGIKGERVTVFDANGRIVKQEVINERLDIKDLESGVYYLQVNNITTKLVKQ